MSREVDFSLQFDGPFTGKMTMEDGEIPPDPGPGLPPSQPGEEPYHWYQDGEGMSILVRDQKLNGYMPPERPGETIQAVYRSGTLAGQFQLPPGQPVQDGVLVIRFKDVPFKFPGLHSWTPGNCWYRNDDNYDLTPGMARFEEYEPGKYEMRFYFANPDDSGKMKRLQNGFPYDWQGYGLHLSWVVPIP